MTTLFVGNYYEQQGSQVTKYYFAGATRIAMRKYTIPQSMSVEYLLGDHLGSTSVTTDSNGAKVSEMRYKPWGEVRYAWTAGLTTTPAYKLTKYTFTGQYSYMDDPSTSSITEGFGLMFYNARWYDPSLGRFAQADTIVPEVGNSQAWDRYAYVNNNPLNLTDPSGHNPECGPDGIYCSNNFEEAYGITFEGDWTVRNKATVRIAVEAIAAKFALTLRIKNPAMAFNMIFWRGITLAWVHSYTDPQGNVHYSGAITKSTRRIEFASMPEAIGARTPAMAITSARNLVVHELGHAFASLWFRKGGNYDPEGPYVNMPTDKKFLSNDGFYQSPAAASLMWRQHPCTWPDASCPHEVFADMFLAWVFDKWGEGDIGYRRQEFMMRNMPAWVAAAAGW